MNPKSFSESVSPIIRESTSEDLEALLRIERLAFGSDEEADLVAGLLKDPSAQPVLSLLAEEEGRPVGHILFTRIYAEAGRPENLMHILAPMAVLPEWQGKGIGGKLIDTGLKMLKERGSKLVFVLGHMEYYPRFGFRPDAASLGFFPPYSLPPEHANAWMVHFLGKKPFMQEGFKLRSADTLQKPEYWVE